eukprot:1149203-Pelagomonas_calceolata.AAC.3
MITWQFAPLVLTTNRKSQCLKKLRSASPDLHCLAVDLLTCPPKVCATESKNSSLPNGSLALLSAADRQVSHCEQGGSCGRSAGGVKG